MTESVNTVVVGVNEANRSLRRNERHVISFRCFYRSQSRAHLQFFSSLTTTHPFLNINRCSDVTPNLLVHRLDRFLICYAWLSVNSELVQATFLFERLEL